ncbi:hypothetical protein Droror1_Dr00020392 [Drosera rotundifolia]
MAAPSISAPLHAATTAATETFIDTKQKDDIRHQNILVGCGVANAVRTSLGPKGMDKMIQTASSKVIITNDGATILNKMEVLQPAAKMLVELSKSQDVVVGDGTTTVVVIAGALLKNGGRGALDVEDTKVRVSGDVERPRNGAAGDSEGVDGVIGVVEEAVWMLSIQKLGCLVTLNGRGMVRQEILRASMVGVRGGLDVEDTEARVSGDVERPRNGAAGDSEGVDGVIGVVEEAVWMLSIQKLGCLVTLNGRGMVRQEILRASMVGGGGGLDVEDTEARVSGDVERPRNGAAGDSEGVDGVIGVGGRGGLDVEHTEARVSGDVERPRNGAAGDSEGVDGVIGVGGRGGLDVEHTEARVSGDVERPRNGAAGRFEGVDGVIGVVEEAVWMLRIQKLGCLVTLNGRGMVRQEILRASMVLRFRLSKLYSAKGLSLKADALRSRAASVDVDDDLVSFSPRGGGGGLDVEHTEARVSGDVERPRNGAAGDSEGVDGVIGVVEEAVWMLSIQKLGCLVTLNGRGMVRQEILRASMVGGRGGLDVEHTEARVSGDVERPRNGAAGDSEGVDGVIGVVEEAVWMLSIQKLGCLVTLNGRGMVRQEILRASMVGVRGGLDVEDTEARVSGDVERPRNGAAGDSEGVDGRIRFLEAKCDAFEKKTVAVIGVESRGVLQFGSSKELSMEGTHGFLLP